MVLGLFQISYAYQYRDNIECLASLTKTYMYRFMYIIEKSPEFQKDMITNKRPAAKDDFAAFVLSTYAQSKLREPFEQWINKMSEADYQALVLNNCDLLIAETYNPLDDKGITSATNVVINNAIAYATGSRQAKYSNMDKNEWIQMSRDATLDIMYNHVTKKQENQVAYQQYQTKNLNFDTVFFNALHSDWTINEVTKVMQTFVSSWTPKERDNFIIHDFKIEKMGRQHLFNKQQEDQLKFILNQCINYALTHY
jgi:hypothetical protein